MAGLETTNVFDYEQAFRRNRGFLTEEDQNRLRSAHVAVAGLGGVGGAQIQALVRLGVGRFTLADPDTFEISNFNRQMGARLDTVGKSKVEVSKEMILSVNPTAEVRTFGEGLTAAVVDAFLEGTDMVLDALDFNCFEERFLLYEKARKKGLWVLNAAPPGFGSTLLVFDPQGMRFEQYFDLRPGMTTEERTLALLCGIVPAPLPLRYLDRNALSGEQGLFPCVSPAFFTTAGMTTAAVVNLLLKKCPLKPVPWVYQFDPLLLRFKKKWYPWGMRGPTQRLKKILIRHLLRKTSRAR